jgi:hypothetical protein
LLLDLAHRVRQITQKNRPSACPEDFSRQTRWKSRVLPAGQWLKNKPRREPPASKAFNSLLHRFIHTFWG